MKKSLVIALMLVGACGDDGGSTADGGPAGECNIEGGEFCFVNATAATATEAGAASWSCAAEQVTTSTADIEVTGSLHDFQDGTMALGSATVEAYYSSTDFGTPSATATTDADGNFTMTLPAGAPSRMSWRMQKAEWFDTYEINDPLDVSTTTASVSRIAVSEVTGTALQAFVGVTRTPGTGVVAGAVRDCDREGVAGTVATISSVSSADGTAPQHVASAQVYYFSDDDLPVKRNLREETNTNGLFVIVQIPPTSGAETYFLQIWGYPQTVGGDMTLLSEFETVVVADSVIIVDMDPTEGPL